MSTDTRPSRSPRRFDVVLWGATGFTGELVAEYLARTYGVGGGVRWALAGRSREKLEKVRSSLEAIDARARTLPLLLGDSADRASLDAIARDARVVASTVGPYALYGKELVAACVEGGTDYCDLTGEFPFVREMIDLHHERARATGSRIVHSCGYDSIPSDLGTLMVQTYMRNKHGGRCVEVKCFAGETTMAISGGTAASMLQLVKDASKSGRVRKMLADPYALDPGRETRGPDGPDQRGPRYDADLERWTGPFMMAATNARIVRRTNALLGYAYGRDFRYREAMSFRAGAKGWFTAVAAAAGNMGFITVAAVPPTRWLLAKAVLPAPGEGPSRERRESGSFVMHLVGIGETSNGSAPTRVFGTVRGAQDPGYGATSRMLGESAVCLALDGEIPPTGGVLTPGACMGMRLVERLRGAGMTFEASETR
ncbi:MAG: saccharopine dehydrogenase family protein [Polyangiaceae bacterium]|jgi:short subunit dehydrogenase-like uncharacterized protein